MIIIGLGNPGNKFKATRHNVGWEVLDLIQKEYNFSPWKESKKFKSEISKGEMNKRKIILVKPLTFMNLSGEAVKGLKAFYKIKIKDILVIHDDIDIPLGKFKISENRGTAGHKGVDSIMKNLKTKNFSRIRIGIKPNKKPENTERFVLLKFNKEEKGILNKTNKTVIEAINTILSKGTKKAMSEFNKKNRD